MQRNISADWVYPVSSPPLKGGVLCVAANGEILAVYNSEEAKVNGLTNIERYEGVLVPGFINTHCHLELSHLFQVIPDKTGLTSFVSAIVANREHADEVVLAAMQKADEEMYLNGIVAVGDIANQAISLAIKQKSKIYYHTFVEVFGFDKPSKPIIDKAVGTKKDFWPLKASIVPHAPYSVSEELFQMIAFNTSEGDILSIHNQETAAENEFFEKGTGSFEQMYIRLNMAKAAYHGNGKNSIHYHLPKFPANNTLLVHNTFTKRDDIDFALQHHLNIYWCFCPNANLYIEDNLPDLTQFSDPRVKITLGTDSLASNHQLNILAEMQTLQLKKRVKFDDLLKWATLNGASFLNIDDKFGSFDKGKSPGVNLIQLVEGQIIQTANVQRII